MRILVVDKRLRIRFALKLLIEQATGHSVVAEVADAKKLTSTIWETAPDLVLLEWELIQEINSEMINSLKADHPQMKVVVLSGKPHCLKSAIDAGADLVIGTHPHVPQGIEIYKEKIILYSVPNFVFDGWQGGFNSILVNATISKEGVNSAFFRPMVSDEINRPEVPALGSEKFDEICQLMIKLSAELGTALTVEGDKVWIRK